MQNETAANGKPSEGRSARDFVPGKLMPFLITLFTVGIFVGAILFVIGQVRSRLHEGYLREDAEVLLAVIANMESKSDGSNSSQERLLSLLEASEFRDQVWGIRLFDQNGKFVMGFPKDLKPEDLDEKGVASLRKGETFGKFEPSMIFATQFLDQSAQGIQVGNYTDVGPVLRSTIPVWNGSAQFLMNGERVQAKLRTVDADVKRYAIWVGVAGSFIIAAALAWAFWRLEHSNTLLQKRTADLLRANHELTLAAKTSAVGAVAAHLIHGLKNPLFGLQMFVSHKMENKDEETQLEWKAAADAAHRMQMMIADIVRILREDTGEAYEISVGEVLGILEGKIVPIAREKLVGFETKAKCTGKLANREANLVILALTNLIQNAIQASKAETKVTLEVYRKADVFCFDVTDQAGGIPKKMREKLFTPCASTKPGGTGLGLAITKQLANHMGGQLEMVNTNEVGTTFRLSIPETLFQAPADADAKLTNAMA
jgi:signal transduction histidine kinase